MLGCWRIGARGFTSCGSRWGAEVQFHQWFLASLVLQCCWSGCAPGPGAGGKDETLSLRGAMPPPTLPGGPQIPAGHQPAGKRLVSSQFSLAWLLLPQRMNKSKGIQPRKQPTLRVFWSCQILGAETLIAGEQ